MLVLSRKLNESIVIDGRIIVKIVRVDGDVVKLGIAAPADVPVHREEVLRRNPEEQPGGDRAAHRLVTQAFNEPGNDCHARSHPNRWQDRRPNPDMECPVPNPKQPRFLWSSTPTSGPTMPRQSVGHAGRADQVPRAAQFRLAKSHPRR